jgi:protocatechuate 3,4-dioxygenase, alpha subunit
MPVAHLMPVATANQTIGPYWHLIEDKAWADLTRFGATGDVVRITGRLSDGAGAPMDYACVEIWQADPPASERFPAFGRSATDAAGEFHFTTLKPGPVAGPGNAQQAPHLAIAIFARGLLKHLVTRLYFAGDARNDTDPLLSAIDDPARRASLIAQPQGDGVWRLDIRLQGDGETVFLEV